MYSVDPEHEIFDLRGSPAPPGASSSYADQYVAHVFPLTATSELTAFFAGNMLLRQGEPAGLAKT